MRIHILSDLHLEIVPYTPVPVEADVVVLAGDIWAPSSGTPDRAAQWAHEAYPDTPVVFVPGNHEYYGSSYPKALNQLYGAAPDVYVMDRRALEIDGVRFLGCTLWTDYNLFGNGPVAELHALQGMNDFRRVRMGPEYRKPRPFDFAALFQASLRWLAEKLAEPFDGATVVVTHHAPSIQGVPPRFHGDALTPAFASRLDDFVSASGAALWIHGHTHFCTEYQLGGTRVLSNARGYLARGEAGFNPELVVEV